MHHDLVDVLIIEDESELARLHAELVQKHPRLRLAGMAASLAQARQLLHATPPQLVLLDNYLPDGKGVTLMTDPALTTSSTEKQCASRPLNSPCTSASVFSSIPLLPLSTR